MIPVHQLIPLFLFPADLRAPLPVQAAIRTPDSLSRGHPVMVQGTPGPPGLRQTARGLPPHSVTLPRPPPSGGCSPTLPSPAALSDGRPASRTQAAEPVARKEMPTGVPAPETSRRAHPGVVAGGARSDTVHHAEDGGHHPPAAVAGRQAGRRDQAGFPAAAAGGRDAPEARQRLPAAPAVPAAEELGRRDSEELPALQAHREVPRPESGGCGDPDRRPSAPGADRGTATSPHHQGGGRHHSEVVQAGAGGKETGRGRSDPSPFPRPLGSQGSRRSAPGVEEGGGGAHHPGLPPSSPGPQGAAGTAVGSQEAAGRGQDPVGVSRTPGRQGTEGPAGRGPQRGCSVKTAVRVPGIPCSEASQGPAACRQEGTGCNEDPVSLPPIPRRQGAESAAACSQEGTGCNKDPVSLPPTPRRHGAESVAARRQETRERHQDSDPVSTPLSSQTRADPERSSPKRGGGRQDPSLRPRPAPTQAVPGAAAVRAAAADVREGAAGAAPLEGDARDAGDAGRVPDHPRQVPGGYGRVPPPLERSCRPAGGVAGAEPEAAFPQDEAGSHQAPGPGAGTPAEEAVPAASGIGHGPSEALPRPPRGSGRPPAVPAAAGGRRRRSVPLESLRRALLLPSAEGEGHPRPGPLPRIPGPPEVPATAPGGALPAAAIPGQDGRSGGEGRLPEFAPSRRLSSGRRQGTSAASALFEAAAGLHHDSVSREEVAGSQALPDPAPGGRHAAATMEGQTAT